MTVRHVVPRMKVTNGDVAGLKVQAIVNLAGKSVGSTLVSLWVAR